MGLAIILSRHPAVVVVCEDVLWETDGRVVAACSGAPQREDKAPARGARRSDHGRRARVVLPAGEES